MLESMGTTAYEYGTERLDHLGIVAGICKQIELAKVIDESLPTPSGRKVSCGQATVVMVLNALGLTGRALYLMPEYMSNKPVDILVGEGLKAEDFNDDTLGRGLDELFQAGITELFARVAAEAVTVYNIEHEYVHLDTSSFSLHGEYESAVAQEAVTKRGAIQVTHGYSKEKRPDLKQVVVSLITSQQSALPLWLEALDGNSSDKKSFPDTVQAYCQHLETDELPWFVMDSASYSKANLARWDNVGWLTRVPETIATAKRALQSVATEEMTALDNGYRIHALDSDYGQVQQRWLVVYSPTAWEREVKRLDKQVGRTGEKAGKELRQITQAQFACEADARKVVQRLDKKMKWHTIQAQYTSIKKYAQPGRPGKGVVPRIVGWKVQGKLVVNEETVAQARRWLGRFILATNELDTERLSDSAMLAGYKAQGHSVERGFRFLKDPMFFADSLFLKSPARIMAMIMVMGLSLLVYALAERELRRQLKAQNETIPDQKGKPTQTPTMRRVAQMFEGIDVLVIRAGDQVVERRVLNLSQVRLKIIHLLGPEVENCYLVRN
jgi:transposase